MVRWFFSQVLRFSPTFDERSVRSEIFLKGPQNPNKKKQQKTNYSEPSSNAPDKAQFSLGCIHLRLAALTRAQMGYNPNSTVPYLGHMSTIRNNLFFNFNIF